jgi:hypothetical protein
MSDPIAMTMRRIQKRSQAVNVAYQSAYSERHRLALWEEDQDLSILGELEILTSQIQGYAGRIVSGKGFEAPLIEVAKLQKLAAFAVPCISIWYLTEGEQYPLICAYLETLDHLRLLLIEQLEREGDRVVA